jgi:hypothetical protein
VLVVAGKALPNVRDAHVQLGSRAKSTFPDLEAISTLDTIIFCCPARLASEHNFSSHFF